MAFSTVEKAGRILGATAGMGIAALWVSLSLHPNSGGAQYILIAASMMAAALTGVVGAIASKPALLFAAFAVSVPSGAYFLLVESIHRAIGYLTPLLLLSGVMIYMAQHRNAGTGSVREKT